MSRYVFLKIFAVGVVVVVVLRQTYAIFFFKVAIAVFHFYTVSCRGFCSLRNLKTFDFPLRNLWKATLSGAFDLKLFFCDY